MRTLIRAIILLVCSVSVAPVHASVFGQVRVLAHDPQHRAIAGASVTVKSSSSDWSQTATTNAEGVAAFPAIPVGNYEVAVKASGFGEQRQAVAAVSGRIQELHFNLAV